MISRPFFPVLKPLAALALLASASTPNWMLAQSTQSPTRCIEHPQEHIPMFADGDTVVFLGDSITHSRTWHRYIADYYTTHFPTRKITYINAGISGDTAPGSLKRLDRDVLQYRPTVVVVMLGMNDVAGKLYAPEGASPSVLKDRKLALETYGNAMRAILSRIQSSGVRKVILLSPSPYDDTSALPLPNQMGKNQGLSLAADIVRRLAEQTGSSYIDFHTPMTEILREQQLVAPAFSLNPVDRIHPGEPGNLLMAWLFLRAQGVPDVDTVHLLDKGSPECIRCTTSGIVHSQGGWQFDLTEESLPQPFDIGAKPALRWRPIERDLGAEVLRVDDVLPGMAYTVSIDGTAVGTYGTEALQEGVDLGENTLTPQYRQAQGVIALNEKWRALASSLRDVEKVRNSVLIPAGKENLSFPETEAFLRAWVKKRQSEDPQGSSYYVTLVPKALATMPHEDDIRQTIYDLQRQARELATPKTHHVSIIPSNAAVHDTR